MEFVVQQGDREVLFAVGTEPTNDIDIDVDRHIENNGNHHSTIGDDDDDDDGVHSYLSWDSVGSDVGSEGLRASIFYSQWSPLIDDRNWTELESVMEDCPPALFSYCAILCFEKIVMAAIATEEEREENEYQQQTSPPTQPLLPGQLLQTLVKKLSRLFGIHNIVSRCLLHMDHVQCSRVMLDTLLAIDPEKNGQLVKDSLHWTETWDECESILDKPYIQLLTMSMPRQGQVRRIQRDENDDTNNQQHHDGDEQDQQETDNEIKSLLEKTCIWLETAYRPDSDIPTDTRPSLEESDSGTLPSRTTDLHIPPTTLHRMAGTACANAAIGLAIRSCPPEEIKTPDVYNQQLPLHYAVSHMTHHVVLDLPHDDPDPAAAGNDHNDQQQDDKTIQQMMDSDTCRYMNMTPAAQQLLQAYPAAASLANADGFLPLHLALLTGFPKWEDQYHLRYYHRTEHEQQQHQTQSQSQQAGYVPHCLGTIRALLRAAPEVLQEQDVVHGLYPFQLAALECSVDIIYTLLRECPSLVQVDGIIDDDDQNKTKKN